jgi:hypothetical protein
MRPAKNSETGETLQVSVDDPRLLTGELVGNTKGMMMAKYPLTGETIQVSVNDPRLLSGELVGINKGRIYMHLNGYNKMVQPSSISEYESLGWRRGMFRQKSIL